MEICLPDKKGMYGFVWRVIFEDGLYQLQRFSKEYQTWMTVTTNQTQEPITKLYEELGE